MFLPIRNGLLGALTILQLAFTGQTASAYDLSLLKNDKELKTHAFNRLQKELSLRRVSQYSEMAYNDFGNSINELEAREQLCELNLYRHFKNKLITDSIPSHPKAVHDLLVAWRSENLIDDLLFKIIDQTADVAESMENFKAEAPSSREVGKMKSLIAKKEITPMDLSAIYRDFSGASLKSSNCTLANWTRTSTYLLEISKDTDDFRLFNIAALDLNVISPEEFELVEFYRSQKIEKWNTDLDHYLDLLKSVKNISRAKEPTANDFLPNELSSKKKKTKGMKKEMTYRESIYSRYNSTQILMIEQVMKKTFERMDATKTEVVFTFKEGSETVPVSPMGQYYLARRLLRKEMDDLNRSSFFLGTPVTHEDLIAVSLETGLINAGILDSVLKIDDLWNPEVKQWRKIANFGFQVTGTASIFLPPPYNLISSIALVFIEGVIQRGTKKASQAEADYDFF